MKFTSDPSPKNLLDSLRQVAEESMEANLKYIQDVWKVFGQLAERRSYLSDLRDGDSKTLNQILTEYMATNTAYASQLLDLGTEFTAELMRGGNQLQQCNKAKEQYHTQVFDLKMSGLPGTLCQTTFLLDNNCIEPLKAKFNYSMLIDAAGEHALDVPIQFSPPLMKLERLGDKKQIIVRLTLPPDITSGLYHTIITIKGPT